MKKCKDAILGVIYPLHPNIAKNIFINKKNIFIKYLTHEPSKKTKLRLNKGMKLYIYASGKNKSIIGDAEIKEITYMVMSEILIKFKDKLFNSPIELKKYACGRENKMAQVLKLKDIKYYSKEINLIVPLTMAGLYVTKFNKDKIFKNEKNK
jgi:hypothetical protein